MKDVFISETFNFGRLGHIFINVFVGGVELIGSG